MNFTKLEHLVRELCQFKKPGDGRMSRQLRCDRRRQTVAWHDRAAAGTLYKTGMCSSRTGKTDDDLPETVCEYNQVAGHVLMTKNTMVNPVSRENAKNTFDELFRLGAIPIVNENDTVSTYEMQFGDNDTLSAIVASLIGADLLILLSDIDWIIYG